MHGWLSWQMLQTRLLHQPRRRGQNETQKEANTFKLFEWLKNARRRLREEKECEGRKEADDKKPKCKIGQTCYIQGCHLELLFAHSGNAQSVWKNAQ